MDSYYEKVPIFCVIVSLPLQKAKYAQMVPFNKSLHVATQWQSTFL